MTDDDARLVDLYDGDNPDGPDHDFYRSLADGLGARTVLDLGCGTGILTVTFARAGRSVVGIDPSTAMLDYARRRPRGSDVRWIQGDSRDIPATGFDYAVMTGNVAQHIPDPEWSRTLRDLRSAIRPGGRLAFESRNPATRAWAAWERPEPTMRQTMHGRLRKWSHVREIGSGRVVLTTHSLFETDGDQLVTEQTLTFRTSEQIRHDLEEAGFDVEHIWGGWDRVPFDGDQPIMVFEAIPRAAARQAAAGEHLRR